MNKILPPEYFNKPILEVSENLLGKKLVRNNGKEIISLLITEVEAYDGPNDLASHGRFGKTKRNEAIFGPSGHFYVYLIYGMYYMLNIVIGPKDYPAAILIRGTKEISGPGRLTKALNLNQSFNKKSASPENNLWFEETNIKINKDNILKTPRIGIDYAGPIWSKKPYRFLLKI